MVKRVDLGGHTFQISSLTLAQVEMALDPDRPSRERAWLTVRSAMANAAPLQPADPGDLDVEDFETLQDAVFDISGLRPKATRHDPKQRNPDPLDFDEIRARLCTHCGWTVEECDRAPFRVVQAIFDYWVQVPSVDALFSAWIGYRPEQQPRRRSVSEDSTQDEKVRFVKQWGGQVKSRDNLPAFMQESLARDGLLSFEPPNPSVN